MKAKSSRQDFQPRKKLQSTEYLHHQAYVLNTSWGTVQLFVALGKQLPLVIDCSWAYTFWGVTEARDNFAGVSTGHKRTSETNCGWVRN